MAGWLDQGLVINATAVYLTSTTPIEAGSTAAESVDNAAELLCRDSDVTLPAVRYKTTTANIMGDIEVPIFGQIENMLLTIHHHGFRAESMAKLCEPGAKQLEIKWAQQWINEAASQTLEAGTAYITGTSQELAPELALVAGNAAEHDTTFIVTKYKLVVGGVERIDVDRLSGIIKVNGVSDSRNPYSII